MVTKEYTRRVFLRSLGLYSGALAMGAKLSAQPGNLGRSDLPNILWITCEDISPNLGCYGDKYAITPNLDRFARQGVLYTRAFASAPVCSPARSCIITGVHACSLGTQHLRRTIAKPDSIRCFTEYLRQAGYYCTNNSKQDYQFVTPKQAWDESSKQAHWRKRPKGRPFFSVFNLEMTHQSKTRYLGEKLARVNADLPQEFRHNPDAAPLPPYYPDTRVIRENIAAYYTQVTLMDRKVAGILKQLADDELAEETIVFFFSDHGMGLPRGKRWLHETGIAVPFIIRFPPKYKHLAPAKAHSRIDRLISFVDLAPTMLSLANVPIAHYMQGKAFLGANAEKPRSYIFATRDRVDEVIECSRTLHDGRYHYIRNFLPHRPRMQLSSYSEITPIRKELRRLGAEGKLEGDAKWLMTDNKPAEELYDTGTDKMEIKNLATSPKHQTILIQMRKALYTRMVELRDTAMLTEDEMHRRCADDPPYDVTRRKDACDIERIVNTAALTGMGTQHLDKLAALLADADSAVRYWAAVGLAALGAKAEPAANELNKALQDSSPSVRIAAAEALCNIGHENRGLSVLAREIEMAKGFVQVEAASALFAIRKKIRPEHKQIHAALTGKPNDNYSADAIRHVAEYLSQRGRPRQN